MIKLYRAVSSFDGKSEQINWYTNIPRKPRDTELELHEICDTWFYERFGIYARSRTVFCSTIRAEASKYLKQGGTILEVFTPESEIYTAIYSPLVTDLYSETRYLKEPFEKSEVYDLLDSFNYLSTDDLSTIPIECATEVMLYINRFLVREA